MYNFIIKCYTFIYSMPKNHNAVKISLGSFLLLKLSAAENFGLEGWKLFQLHPVAALQLVRLSRFSQKNYPLYQSTYAFDSAIFLYSSRGIICSEPYRKMWTQLMKVPFPNKEIPNFLLLIRKLWIYFLTHYSLKLES